MLKDFFSVPVYIHNFNYDTNLLSKSCFQYMTDNREVIEKKAGQDIKSIYDLQLTWVKDENISLDKTMTVLDRYIEKAEKILQL